MLIEMIRIFSYHYFPTDPIIAASHAKTIDRADWPHLLGVLYVQLCDIPVGRRILQRVSLMLVERFSLPLLVASYDFSREADY
jgi:hypothetical protein